MKLLLPTLGAAGFATTALASSVHAHNSYAGLPARSNSSAVAAAAAVCKKLAAYCPPATSFANSTAYIEGNTDFWTVSAALGPACVFSPTNANDLSVAVQILRPSGVKFAVRGGGHMPIVGYNNIDSTGVLLSTANLTAISYSKDGQSLNYGPGNRWKDVYKFLEPSGKLIVAGRLGVVGIPGLMTGGGLSYLGTEHGWASNSVVSMDVVLANGKLVHATNTNQYSDLLWALKGGGNSFGIVTNIESKLYPAPGVTAGQAEYGTGDNITAKWQDAIVQLANNGNADVKHAVIPRATITSLGPGIDYSVYKFYNGNNDTAPAILANFSAPNLPTISDTFAPKSLYNFSVEGPDVSAAKAFAQRFYFLSIPATNEALSTVQDATMAYVNKTLPTILPLWIFTLAAMPMVSNFFEAAIRNGGDPMGVKPQPQIWLEFSHLYNLGAGGEAAVDSYVQGLDKEVRGALSKIGSAPIDFLYLNDCDKFQDVFGSYPKGNVARLKSIRAKYDPSRMYTDQLPGGWKVDKAA